MTCARMQSCSGFLTSSMRSLLQSSQAQSTRLPTCIGCVCSAGVRHRQLVKSGNDDLRQDAVMQQLFGLINEVLAHSPATAKRRLRIVTYKVNHCFSISHRTTAVDC